MAYRWNDLLAPAILGKPTAGGKPDYDYTNGGYLFPKNDPSEALQFQFQMPHDWAIGTTIYPHVHVQQARNEQATFRFTYNWAAIGAAAAAPSGTYDCDTYAAAYTSGTIHQLVHGAAGISGSGISGVSSVLKMVLARTDNVYDATMLVTSVDIHYQIASIGSRSQFA